MYTPTEEDRHIFLYAKGWYKKTDRIEDLKKILTERSSISEEFITIDDVLLVLNTICERYTNFPKFMNSLRIQIKFNKWENRYPCIEDMIIYLLISELACVKISDIPFELGKPDINILPLKEEEETNG